MATILSLTLATLIDMVLVVSGIEIESGIGIDGGYSEVSDMFNDDTGGNNPDDGRYGNFFEDGVVLRGSD